MIRNLFKIQMICRYQNYSWQEAVLGKIDIAHSQFSSILNCCSIEILAILKILLLYARLCKYITFDFFFVIQITLRLRTYNYMCYSYDIKNPGKKFIKRGRYRTMTEARAGT